MKTLLAAASPWVACAYFALGLVGAVGLLAIVSPRRFTALAGRGTVDTGSYGSVSAAPALDAARTDAWSRLIGFVLLTAVGFAAYWLARA